MDPGASFLGIPGNWYTSPDNAARRALKTRKSSHFRTAGADADTYEQLGQETAVEDVNLGGSKLGIPEDWIASPDNIGKRSNDAGKLVTSIDYNKQALTTLAVVSFDGC